LRIVLGGEKPNRNTQCVMKNPLVGGGATHGEEVRKEKQLD